MLVSGVLSSWLTLAVNSRLGRELAAHRLVVLAQFAVGLHGARQGDQFLIRDVGLDGVEVFGQAVDGPNQPPRQPGRKQRRPGQNQHRRAQQQRQRVGAQPPDGVDVLRDAQHLHAGGRFHPQGAVVGLAVHRFAFTRGGAAAVLQRGGDLRAVGVAGQRFVSLVVVQHRAVGGDQRAAQLRVGQQGGEVVGVPGALGFVPGGQRGAQPLQGVVHALGIAALEQRGRGGQRGNHAQRPYQDQRLAVQPRHALGACGAAFLVTHRRPPC